MHSFWKVNCNKNVPNSKLRHKLVNLQPTCSELIKNFRYFFILFGIFIGFLRAHQLLFLQLFENFLSLVLKFNALQFEFLNFIIFLKYILIRYNSLTMLGGGGKVGVGNLNCMKNDKTK